MTRAERIQIVLDLLRGTKDRPDLRQLEAELFHARDVNSKAPLPSQAAGLAGIEPAAPQSTDLNSGKQPRAPRAMPAASLADQPASLGFLMNEHPAILAQQMMGQSEEDRSKALAACSGPLARQIRYLLTNKF